MTRRIAVVTIGIVASALIVADLVIIALPRTTAMPDVYGFRGSGAVLAVSLAIVGAAIALRQPRNSVGWMFLLSGTLAPLVDSEYASYALVGRGGALGPICTLALLVFPNGRLPLRRWRPVPWYTVR